MQKAEMRKKYLNKRSRLSFSEVNRMSKKITDKFFSLNQVIKAKKIMGYVSKAKEVNTFPLLEKLLDEGYLLYVPYTKKNETALGTAQINDLKSELKEGTFGVLEPIKNIRDQKAHHNLDIIIVPGAVFSKSGFRIGYGGGYYDSFLSTYGQNALKIGFCFDEFLLDELPSEEHDIAVDIIITEKDVIRV